MKSTISFSARNLFGARVIFNLAVSIQRFQGFLLSEGIVALTSKVPSS